MQGSWSMVGQSSMRLRSLWFNWATKGMSRPSLYLEMLMTQAVHRCQWFSRYRKYMTVIISIVLFPNTTPCLSESHRKIAFVCSPPSHQPGQLESIKCKYMSMCLCLERKPMRRLFSKRLVMFWGGEAKGVELRSPSYLSDEVSCHPM